MLEIFAIIYFSKKVGQRAEEKGYARGWFVFFFVLFWIIGEFTGAIVGAFSFGEGMQMYLSAIFGAAIGGSLAYLIVAVLKDKEREQAQIDY